MPRGIHRCREAPSREAPYRRLYIVDAKIDQPVQARGSCGCSACMHAFRAVGLRVVSGHPFGKWPERASRAAREGLQVVSGE